AHAAGNGRGGGDDPRRERRAHPGGGDEDPGAAVEDGDRERRRRGREGVPALREVRHAGGCPERTGAARGADRAAAGGGAAGAGADGGAQEGGEGGRRRYGRGRRLPQVDQRPPAPARGRPRAVRAALENAEITRQDGQAAASFARVSARCSGSTFTSARTGMKFVSPDQRGTRCRWTWSTIPAPAIRPRFQPTL